MLDAVDRSGVDQGGQMNPHEPGSGEILGHLLEGRALAVDSGTALQEHMTMIGFDPLDRR
jgi:hypothetical protein